MAAFTSSAGRANRLRQQGLVMPTVPNIDPAQLEAATGGQYQPEVPHLLMAASDMHQAGRLVEPGSQPQLKPQPARGKIRAIRKRR